MRESSSNRTWALLVAVVATIAMACGAAITRTSAADGPLPLGTWGGDSAGLIVSDTAAHLHIGCTFGDVSGRIELSAQGEFDVQGSYMLRAYPITIRPAVPARFVGHASNNEATITVTVNDTVTGQTVVRGPVVVRLGIEPRLGPCPICRRPIVTAPSFRSAATR